MFSSRWTAAAAAAVCGVFALGSVPGAHAQSFCSKYTTALFGADTPANEQSLITAVVTRAALGNTTVTPPVYGIVAPNSPILQFFNGSVPFRHSGTTPNFLTSQSDFNTLAAHLVQFFGQALGCTTTGFPTGVNQNMTYVHELMYINNAQETYFNNAVAASMLSFGVTASDVQTVAVPFLATFNRYPYINGPTFPAGSPAGTTTLNQICSQPDCPEVPAAYSFCEKYATALFGNASAANEQQLMSAVLSRAFAGSNGVAGVNGVVVQGLVGAGSPITQFFNGSVQFRNPGPTPNFVANQNGSGDILMAHLLQFFGAAFGCNAQGFPSYQGNKNMTAVHQNMAITQQYEQYFITQVANTALSFGVSQNDTAAVGNVLALFNNQPPSTGMQICNQPSCQCAPGWTGTNNCSVSTSSTGSSSSTGAAGPSGGAAAIAPSTVLLALAAAMGVAAARA